MSCKTAFEARFASSYHPNHYGFKVRILSLRDPWRGQARLELTERFRLDVTTPRYNGFGQLTHDAGCVTKLSWRRSLTRVACTSASGFLVWLEARSFSSSI